MFRETLLESSPALRKRSPWPMATAFTVQLIIASVLILLPLLSTGIPVLSTHLAPPPRYTPIADNVRPTATAASPSHADVSLPSHAVVQLVNLNPRLASPFFTMRRSDVGDSPVAPPIGAVGGDPDATKNLIETRTTPPPPPGRQFVVSHSLEAMILNKVIPEYPVVARVAGVQGDVKLHAIIAKDGTIQSLTVTSGPEMLRAAALRAVEQWRYRPYMLNGVAVEVETVITVSFKRS